MNNCWTGIITAAWLLGRFEISQNPGKITK